MNPKKAISTAILLLFLGITLPSFAEKGGEKKGGGEGKARQGQHQEQPQHQHQQQSVAYHSANHGNDGNGNHGYHGNGNNGHQYGRISDDHYHANFGHGHSFHMMRPRMIGGYNRFQYGGYWFGYNQGWPGGWNYDDDVYVVYEHDGYYMYNLRHPGIHITLRVF